MERQIRALLDEVPAGFQPTFQPKPESERIVGSLDDLDADARRIVVGAHYFLEQANALLEQVNAIADQAIVLNDAHELEHQQEGFVPRGEACTRNHQKLAELGAQAQGFQEQSEAMAAKMRTLQVASGPAVYERFKLQPGERLGFHTEGATAAPPEPENPFRTMIQRLGAQGIGVSVISVGSDGQLIELTPGFTPDQQD